MSIDRARKLRNEFQEKVDNKENKLTHNSLFRAFGYWDTDEALLQLFQKGIESAEEVDEEYFYFRDFK